MHEPKRYWYSDHNNIVAEPHVAIATKIMTPNRDISLHFSRSLEKQRRARNTNKYYFCIHY